MKRSKNEKKSKYFLYLVIPSVICVFTCFLSNSRETFAWFNTRVTYSEHTLVAASFELEVAIDGTPLTGEVLPGTHEINITRTGESNTIGFASIIIGDKTYAVINLEKDVAFSFTITTDVQENLEIHPSWGVPPSDIPTIQNGEEIIIDLIEDEELSTETIQ